LRILLAAIAPAPDGSHDAEAFRVIFARPTP
jgi:hypothetical protein